jgi:hypothetical protein
MAIRFKHGGETFTADSPEEAVKLRALLKQQEAVDLNPERFLRFIERLGTTQRKAVSLLVTRQRVTDEELRDALSVSGNQALAGVLIGVSRHATALGIPARAIFSFENFRQAGKRRSTYSVSDKFLQIATGMNWPK